MGEERKDVSNQLIKSQDIKVNEDLKVYEKEEGQKNVSILVGL